LFPSNRSFFNAQGHPGARVLLGLGLDILDFGFVTLPLSIGPSSLDLFLFRFTLFLTPFPFSSVKP
jgi:hypothetical protein